MTQTIRVPLASNVLYVSGTVNGVDCVWTREEGNWWSTVADRATDGVYRVALSIIYGDGQTVTDGITLYYGLVLITDRTKADVDRVKQLASKGWSGMTTDEKTEWESGMKGAYNVSDLNRVGSAMAYIRDRFNDNGYSVEINPYTTWREKDIPDESDMTLYLWCLGTLRGVLALPPETPATPSTMENLTYITANDIEKILEAIDEVLTKSIAFLWYSGDIYSGEVI